MLQKCPILDLNFWNGLLPTKCIQVQTIFYIPSYQNPFGKTGHQKSKPQEHSIEIHSQAKILKMNRTFSTTFLDVEMMW